MNVRMTWLPSGVVTRTRAQTTVLVAARQGRIVIPSRCAGKASCLLCLVDACTPETLTDPTPAEHRLLGDAVLAQGRRLACQARVIADTTIALRPSRLHETIARLLQRRSDVHDD
ncbi:MAG: 2Fe-2S iron-sulfur cluster binding domain-containing protein [Paenibacillaceae bacterium]|jgi:ferredoxin|nr:2Fe-2S iron-sulfur cluster binding domain-containing protein [Paenibacillaceae bacterium]